MKITQKHYAQLKLMLDQVMKKHDMPVSKLIELYVKHGLSEKRGRWDLIWAVNYEPRQAWFDEVYQYANDEHIDTALRKYVQDA